MTRRSFFALALLALSALPAHALSPDTFPPLKAFIDQMAANHGFSKTTLNAWFADVEIREDILEAIARPAEALAWHEYRKRFVTDDSVRRGIAYWRRNAPTLERAAAEYGVPPEVIVAVLGIETRYGANLGRFPVLDALTTLMLRYPQRAEFFRRELEEFLLLARELGADPREFKGSYTGAIGIPQFMPSSYRFYAIDFDSNKKRELRASDDDAIGSVANYFKKNGWRSGEPVTQEARTNGNVPERFQELGAQPKLSLRELREHGVAPVAATQDDLLAALVSLQNEDAEVYRIAYHNFFVILRYNRSKHYAMAVFELSEQLRARFAETQAKKAS